jgi:hypothetical protein
MTFTIRKIDSIDKFRVYHGEYRINLGSGDEGLYHDFTSHQDAVTHATQQVEKRQDRKFSRYLLAADAFSLTSANEGDIVSDF